MHSGLNMKPNIYVKLYLKQWLMLVSSAQTALFGPWLRLKTEMTEENDRACLALTQLVTLHISLDAKSVQIP